MRQIILGLCATLALCVCALTTAAQEPAPVAPYAGQEQRPIKALAPEEIEQLRAGYGMGLAKAAELNHYPGPRHVLDLAAQLKLTPAQRAAAQVIYERMQKAAVDLGAQIVTREAELDRRFAHGHIDVATLQALTGEIARLQGVLRATHLKAHLEMKQVLTPEQIRRYDALRGYDQTTPHKHGAS